MLVAVEGCCHGELDAIYGAIRDAEQRNGFKVDLLICCGDFQAVRNLNDLATMAVKPKYRDMNTFYKYYSGEAVAPVLTLYVGGNHESSAHNLELPLGGWVAPNIFYLGFAGVVNVGGLRIAGVSGIYKSHDFTRGHYETLPLSEGDIRSAYHTREYDVFQLQQLRQPVDIFLSHDWPQHIAHHGNLQQLVRQKRGLEDDIRSGALGSPASMALLKERKPSYWFAAHHHVKFAATVPHQDGSCTRFLSLDKCLPGRDFLQLLEFPDRGEPVLKYDIEWLAILKRTAPLRSISRDRWIRPPPHESYVPSEEELAQMRERVQQCLGETNVPLNFTRTVPPHGSPVVVTEPPMFNPQTAALCELLQIEDPFLAANQQRRAQPPPFGAAGMGGAGAGGFATFPIPAPLGATAAAPPSNPNEISLDDDNDDEDDEFADDGAGNTDEIDIGDDEDAPAAQPSVADGEEVVFKRRNIELYQEQEEGDA